MKELHQTRTPPLQFPKKPAVGGRRALSLAPSARRLFSGSAVLR
jgi:hypothetical protein